MTSLSFVFLTVEQKESHSSNGKIKEDINTALSSPGAVQLIEERETERAGKVHNRDLKDNSDLRQRELPKQCLDPEA